MTVEFQRMLTENSVLCNNCQYYIILPQQWNKEYFEIRDDSGFKSLFLKRADLWADLTVERQKADLVIRA